MFDHRKRIILSLIVFLLSAGTASAHNLRVFASITTDGVQGLAYFVGGGVAGDAQITVYSADGSVLLETRTDRQTGRFSTQIDTQQIAKIRADAGDGHVAEFVLVSDRSEDASPTTTSLPPETVLSEQIAQLARQVDALENHLQMRDIIGGVGYIFGIFGLWALWRSRKKAP